MDSWRVAVLGDGGVGKTALAVQVRLPRLPPLPLAHARLQFTLNCFVGGYLLIASSVMLIYLFHARVVLHYIRGTSRPVSFASLR